MSCDFLFKCSMFFSSLRIGIVFVICTVERGKYGLHPVVVGHVDRIEFVVVAPGALYGGADECVHRVFHHVVTIDVASDTTCLLYTSDAADE